MITFPEKVAGWLTVGEGHALAVFAHNRIVLEIGSFKGRSTICMAQTAERVTCVDPFDGRATPQPEDTRAEFFANLKEFGIENVTAHVGTSDEICPLLTPEFDLVFIDGAHDDASVRNDTEWALRLLKPGGLIAYHDFLRQADGSNPGVDRAVCALLSDGGEIIQRVGSVALVRPPTELLTGTQERRRVVIAMPHRGAMHSAAARAFFDYPTIRGLERKALVTDGEILDLMKLDMSSSVLTLNFNRMWCEALNVRDSGFTHFAMLHDDVCPEPGWLDVLLAEIDRLDADVVSAVIPIKSAHGLTSTALGHDGQDKSIWRPLRRLTMNEVHDLPETFCREDVPLEGPPTLMVNTGCWIADLRKPWVEKNVFRNEQRNICVNGKWKADCMSEDWAFSCDLSRWQAKVYATRKVRLHHDHQAFHNKTPWGMWETDEEYFQRTGTPKPELVEAA